MVGTEVVDNFKTLHHSQCILGLFLFVVDVVLFCYFVFFPMGTENRHGGRFHWFSRRKLHSTKTKFLYNQSVFLQCIKFRRQSFRRGTLQTWLDRPMKYICFKIS